LTASTVVSVVAAATVVSTAAVSVFVVSFMHFVFLDLRAVGGGVGTSPTTGISTLGTSTLEGFWLTTGLGVEFAFGIYNLFINSFLSILNNKLYY
jgi:hypothetical protein